MTLTDRGAEVVIGVRGDFDLDAAARLDALVVEYVVNGGAITDLVLDLRGTSRCRTAALEKLTQLIGAGLRLRASTERRRTRTTESQARASGGA